MVDDEDPLGAASPSGTNRAGVTRHGRLTNFLRSDFMPRRLAIGVFSLLVVVAFTRSPFVFVHGRFWAEEGSFHFRRMVAHPTVRNLVFVQPNLGYYYLFLEASTWLAA